MATVETPKRSKLPAILGVLVVLAAVASAGGWYILQYGGDWQAKAALDKAIAKLPDGMTATYGEVHASLLDHTTSLSGLNVVIAGTKPATVTIDKIEILNPATDLPDIWARIAAKTLPADKETVVAVADSVVMTGLKFKSDDIEFGTGRYSVRAIRLHPWALVQPSTPSPEDLVKALDALGRNPDPAGLLPLARYGAAWALAVDNDATEITGLTETLHMPKTPAMPQGGTITASMDHVTSEGLHRGVIGKVTEETLNEAVQGPNPAKIGIAKITVEPFDLHGPAEKMVAGDPPALDMLNGLKWGGIAFEGITVDAQPAGTLALGGFSLDHFAFDNGVFESGHIGLKALKLTADQIPAAAPFFQSLDITTATVSAEAGFHLSPNGKDLKLHTKIAVAELGVLDQSVDVIAPDGITALAAVPPGQIPSLKLKSAVTRYRDHSLAGRLLKLGAAQQNLKPEPFRAQIIAIVRQQGATLGNDPAVTALLDAIVAFIKAPRGLDIDINPPHPLTSEQMDSFATLPPAKLLPLIGLTIVANPEAEKKP